MARRRSINAGKPIECEPTPADIIRFLSKITVSGECWLWPTTCSDENGYGWFWFAGERRGAHRFAYHAMKRHDPIRAETEIDHLCENHGCVNPAHLSQVTRTENAKRGSYRGHKRNGHRVPEECPI